MLRITLASLTLIFTTTGVAAGTCEPLRAQIEDRIKGAGVTVFTFNVVDARSPPTGKVVGTCDQGSKKIVYVHGGSANGTAAARPPATRRDDAILTECKDGSVSVGGSCRK